MIFAVIEFEVKHENRHFDDFVRASRLLARKYGARGFKYFYQAEESTKKIVINSEWKTIEDYNSFLNDPVMISSFQMTGAKSEIKNEIFKRFESSPGSWARFFLQPIRFPTFLFFGAILLFLFFGFSFPDSYYMWPLLLVLFFLIPLAVFTVIRFSIWRLLRLRYFTSQLEDNVHWRRWSALAVLSAIFITLFILNVPLNIAFATARSSLENTINDIETGKYVKDKKYLRAGIYTFETINIYPEESTNPKKVEFIICNEHRSALVYSVDGLESIKSISAKGHFEGNWYWTEGDKE
jgi:hypothetical protein